LKYSIKILFFLPYDPQIPSLVTYPREMKP
jgi:hypothetical protein